MPWRRKHVFAWLIFKAAALEAATVSKTNREERMNVLFLVVVSAEKPHVLVF
eukprot:SAG31_NODE_1833_length_7137_cov_2.587667_8_plen_52_part_00